MLFIFDWDGTISDSTEKIVQCLSRAIDEVGLPKRHNLELKNIIGLGLAEAISTLFPDIDNERLNATRSAYSRIYTAADAIPSPFYPGVQDTLNGLREAGHKLAVATGKSRQGLDRVLGRLGMQGFFHASRCADETASKPDPRMLYELLAELSTSAEDAVMIGDTEYDLEMATRAGIRSIAVDYGAHELTRLLRHKPVLSVSAFADVQRVLGAYPSGSRPT